MGLNWRAVTRGAVVGLVVVIPLSILHEIVAPGSSDPTGGWLAFITICLLGAFVLAGFVAGRAQPDLPYAHGALGGLGTLVLWVVIRLVRDAFAGRSPRFVAILASALLALAFGIVGGVLATRRPVRADEP